MLDTKPIDKVIFLDIETTSQYPTFESMPDKMKALFEKRFKKDIEDNKILQRRGAADGLGDKLAPPDMEAIYDSKAPLYPEWGKILCISIGTIKRSLPNVAEKDLEGTMIVSDNETLEFVPYTFSGDDDERILLSFAKRTLSVTGSVDPKFALCAHAGMMFDFPFIAKRYILNMMQLPKAWNYSASKPWELPHLIDTNLTWKHGMSFDAGASLDLLAASFGIESSKTDIDGSQVKDVYWKEKNLPRIVTYCEMDIYVLAQVYLRMKGLKHNLTLTIKK